jgi:predicted dehydrogenase
MSHQLGLVSWITGARFTRVSASMYPPRHDIDLHVSANAALSSGGSAALSCASTHPYLARPQWHLALYGSRGQLWVDSVQDTARLVRANGEVVQYSAEEASGDYDPGAPTSALIACGFGAPAPAGMSSELAVHVVETTDALYASAASGGTADIEAVQ